MASLILFSLLLIFSATVASAVDINITTFNIAPTTSSPIPPPPLPSLSVLSQPPPTHHQDSPQQLQFNSIIDQIVGAGDFSNWAKLLSQADPSLFPLTATFFIPDDAVFLARNTSSPANSVDPLLFPYHIVPRRFTFPELRQFPIGARLPTLFPGKTLLITNNSAANFTVNGAPLTHPDLFQGSAVTVHGIMYILDYNLFGEDASSSENPPGLFPSPENISDLFSSPEIPMGLFPQPENNSPDSVPSPPLPEFRQLERGPVIEYLKSAAGSSCGSQRGRVLVVLVTTLILLYVLKDMPPVYKYLIVVVNVILGIGSRI